MPKRVQMLVRPEWWGQAACAGVGPSVFFDPTPDAEEAAKAICGQCPVAGPCLAWAIEQGLDVGILGGMNPGERRRASEGLTTVA
jgi:WhiB family redox-sensing transcriptional regulator